MITCHQLISDGVVANNRAGDELGKEADKAGEIGERSCRSRVATINIDCVAHGLKGVEGYPTVIFYKDGKGNTYEGDRKFEALVDFVNKNK